MPGEIYMAAAAALAYEKRLEVIANNLANVNTAGFKRDEVSFQAYLTSAEGQAQAVQPPYQTPQAGSSFWISYESRTDFSPGPLKMTGNPLDLALNGKGFFSVESPSGTVYTRRGNFTLSSEGVLVTQEGWPVQGEGGGEIRIEGRNGGPNGLEVSIGKDGTVQVNGRKVGRLQRRGLPAGREPRAHREGLFQDGRRGGRRAGGGHFRGAGLPRDGQRRRRARHGRDDRDPARLRILPAGHPRRRRGEREEHQRGGADHLRHAPGPEWAARARPGNAEEDE